jgi:hypothetical protein
MPYAVFYSERGIIKCHLLVIIRISVGTKQSESISEAEYRGQKYPDEE